MQTETLLATPAGAKLTSSFRNAARAKLAGSPEAVPEGLFDAAYTVSRSAYTGEAELEIMDWRKG